jgi:hypothetical protein
VNTHPPKVNFINVYKQILHVQHKSTKKDNKLLVHFALLGSAGAKAVRRTLMKLTPDVDFTNILYAAFVWADSKSLLTLHI